MYQYFKKITGLDCSSTVKVVHIFTNLVYNNWIPWHLNIKFITVKYQWVVTNCWSSTFWSYNLCHIILDNELWMPSICKTCKRCLLLLVGYKRQVWSYKSMKVLRPQFYCPAHVVYPPAVKLIKKKPSITMPPKFSCHFKSDP